MLSDERLRGLAGRLVGVPGVVGVLLGGSRARGDHTPASDVDLGLYYRPPLDVAALGALAREVELCAHALHGRAGRWLVNEKGAVAAAGLLPGAPPDFAARAHAVLAHLGDTPEQLRTARTAAAELVADVRTACGYRP